MLLKKEIAFETIQKLVEEYVVSTDMRLLEEIETILMELTESQYCMLWQYDNKKKKLIRMHVKPLVLAMQKSLLKEVSLSKIAKIENYLISHKSYAPSIDNPLSLSLKSMLIYPLLVKNNSVGYLVLAKDITQKSIFERKMLYRLDRVHKSLAALVSSKTFPIVKIEEVAQNISFEEKEQRASEIVHLKQMITELEVQNNNYRENEKKLLLLNKVVEEKQLHIERLDTEKEKLKSKIIQLEKGNRDYQEIETENKQHQMYISQLERQEIRMTKHLSYLEEKIKRLDQKDKETLQKYTSVSTPANPKSITPLLTQILPTLRRYKYTYMLYEFIMYESEISSMRMYEIEEKIRKSNILWELLEDNIPSSTLNVHNAPIKLKMLISKLKMSQMMLGDKIHIGIEASEQCSEKLQIDDEKVLTTCFHLLSDMQPFITVDEDVTILLNQTEKRLFIVIKGKKNEYPKGLLYKKKFTGMLKERIDLMMAKKVIDILSGTLESYIEDDYCIHKYTIPLG